MILRWREHSGRPGNLLLEKLHGRIGQYQVENGPLQVGLTTDPTRKWSEQRYEDWGEMVVIYSTSNCDFAAAVEKDLAARGWREHFTSWDYNRGAAKVPGTYTRYYVYVLLDKGKPVP